MFGRMMNETLGKAHFWLTFAPFFTIFFMQHFLGLQGAPRRYYAFTAYDYLQKTRGQNLVISIAAFLLVSAQFLFLVNFVWSLVEGPRGRGQSVARDDARVDGAVAAAARQLRRRADRGAMGLRIRRARRRTATSRRRPSRASERAGDRMSAQQLHLSPPSRCREDQVALGPLDVPRDRDDAVRGVHERLHRAAQRIGLAARRRCRRSSG